MDIKNFGQAQDWLDEHFPYDEEERMNCVQGGPLPFVSFVTSDGKLRADQTSHDRANPGLGQLFWNTRDITPEEYHDSVLQRDIRYLREKMEQLGYEIHDDVLPRGENVMMVKDILPPQLPEEIEAVIQTFRGYVGPLAQHLPDSSG